MNSLTKKQKIVFDFIKEYIATNGISPTIAEIKDGLGLLSTSTVHEHLKVLKLKSIF
jgi:repressor LexA